ncbi:MAG TPA: hypothetical protein PK691_09455, partial [Thermomicrobiales bacterium]|nr:hypothetical protein [Thermomicrobiales bacterium]
LLTPAAKAGALPETVPVPDISPLQKANHGWAAYPFGTTWMYLDPTTPGAKPVQRESIATPRAATPEASPQSPAFPEEMYHAVTIRLIVEQMQGTALVQADLVTQHVHVADVDGLPITIAHMSPDALQGLGVSISGTLSGSFTQIPLVAIGDQVTQGSPYLVFGGGGGGVLGALGDAEELTDGEPTAEWIQIDTTAPDGSTTSTRRTIFDRIGDSNRADPEAAIKNLKPVPLVDVDGIGKAYLPLLSVTSLAISGSDSAAARYIPGQIPDTGVEQQANVSYAIQHYLYRLTSVLGPDLGLRLAPDGVNISSVTFSAVAGQPIDSPLVSTDVWLRNIMALPVHGETSNVAPALTIASFGLAAEELAVDSSSWINDLDLSALGLGSPPTPAVTVRSVFESAAAAKIATITLDPSDDLTSKLSLDASSSIYSLIQADLDAGRTVVVPARSVEIDGIPRIGWWAIDPRTGNVIDRMDSGGSAAYVLFSELGEYLAVLRSGLVQANQWKRMGCQAAVIALVASYLLGAPYAGYKAAKDAAAGNYVDSVADAIAGVGGATLAFLGSPAACLA